METKIGQVTRVSGRTAVLSLSDHLELCDTIHFLGQKTDFYQQVLKMEVNQKKVLVTGPGTEVAIPVDEPVHQGDQVLLVPKEEMRSFESAAGLS